MSYLLLPVFRLAKILYMYMCVCVCYWEQKTQFNYNQGEKVEETLKG